MHQSFVVLVPTGPGNSAAINFFRFLKALLNALHCGDKFMVKSLLKAPPSPRPVFFIAWNSLFSVEKVNLYLVHAKRSGLLDTAKFKRIVSLSV